jgi:cell division septation protein DedD
MTLKTWSIGLAGIALLSLAGCGSRPTKAPSPTPVPSRQAPVPPGGALPNLGLPEGDGRGGFRTANSGIAPDEAVWHVRSALNVAALACDDRAIVANYNALLKRQKSVFAAAHKAESRQQGSVSAMDTHMTRLYNFFAQPPVQRGFCAAASRVAADAQSVSAAEFQRFSTQAIVRLDQPFQDFYRAYQGYQRDLAAWRAGGGSQQAAVAQARVAASTTRQAVASTAPWRVQLGAFSGTDAAREAWIEVRRRAPGLAAFKPHYEAASVRGLTRLQIGPANDRQEALRLCAAAAVADLDCLPVSPGAPRR